MCNWYTPEIDHRLIQIFDTLPAASLIPSSYLLQHNANISKNKDKNVIAAPKLPISYIVKITVFVVRYITV